MILTHSYIVAVPVLFPILFGILILACRAFDNRRLLYPAVICTTVIDFILILVNVWYFVFEGSRPETVVLLNYLQGIRFVLDMDEISVIFGVITAAMWMFVSIMAVKYMQHEDHNRLFFGLFLIVEGILLGRDFSGNMVTMYFFYEMMTFTTVPMVLHSRKQESITAGLKYMFYSCAGAMMILFSIFILNQYCVDLDFYSGAALNMEMAAEHESIILIAVMAGIIGFGTKAGMFPMHAWLPSAHPVAPAPASALLSGCITKAGILGVIRLVFYLVGPDFIRGTWVQYTWMILALITVFMGSMMAYLEPVMKKRFAYSTVSQLSYIMFGLSLLSVDGLTGALTHVVFHATIKNGIFMTAGAIIFFTGKTMVKDMRGIGKQMPVIIWSYTFLSLALVGIPPASGFISKWYLALASLNSGIPYISWIGPVILLISAMLTAGYLLPITINGFLPGEDFDYASLKVIRPGFAMTFPILATGILAVLLGIFASPIVNFIVGFAVNIV